MTTITDTGTLTEIVFRGRDGGTLEGSISGISTSLTSFLVAVEPMRNTGSFAQVSNFLNATQGSDVRDQGAPALNMLELFGETNAEGRANLAQLILSFDQRPSPTRQKPYDTLHR